MGMEYKDYELEEIENNEFPAGWTYKKEWWTDLDPEINEGLDEIMNMYANVDIEHPILIADHYSYVSRKVDVVDNKIDLVFKPILH